MKRSRLYYILAFLAIFFASVAEAKENTDKIQIEVTADIQKTGYVGEVFEYTVTLKSSTPQIADIRIVSKADYPQSLKIINGAVRNQRPREITEKGKTYYCWTILKEFIIPREAGKFTIGECKYIAFLAKEKYIDDFFWGRRRVVDYEEIPALCNKVTFKVDKLPENKTGKDYADCVGEYVIEGWFPPGHIKTGQDAIVVFSITGYGSLENLKIPNISKLFVDGCTLKEVEQNDEISQRGGKLFSETILTCKFTPENKDFEIKPLELLFFNPESGKYQTVSSHSLHWTGKENEHKSVESNKDAIAI